jgi:hypothetical protein
MISKFPLWRLRRRRNRNKRYLLLAVTLLFLIDVARITLSATPAARTSSSSSTGAALKKQRVFIASTHWNNEDILRSHWNDAVVDLVRFFGSENVYVSILEGGSWDGSKDALKELDKKLGDLNVRRTIKLNETTHEDEISRVPGDDEGGWIWTKRNKKELRRIPYLAGLRNQAMEPMLEDQREYDKVLWLNDVVFTVHSPMNMCRECSGLIDCSSTMSSHFLPLETVDTLQPAPSTSPNHHSTTTPLPSATH